MALPHRDWHFPTAIRFGNGRLSELPAHCKHLGIHRPLLVTDRGLAELPFIAATRQALESAGLNGAFHGNVDGNPAAEHVDEGITYFLDHDCDGVIGIGGGSAMDCAKAIALAAKQSRDLFDFEDIGDNWLRADSDAIVPIIAIPTTAGTGSEVGRAAVIVDRSSNTKKLLFHPKMLPALVISDPELTVGLPPNITAWTGVDAFVHALEAWCAPGFHPMADGIAVEAMRMVLRWLPTAVKDGQDLDARGNMLVAATMGATAFQKGLGSIHSLSHVLGGLYGLHHGLTNAVIMPYGLARNVDYLESRMPELCRLLDISGATTADVVRRLQDFNAELGIPASLSELAFSEGLDDATALDIGERALLDPSTPSNAGPIDAAGLTALLRDAVSGQVTFGLGKTV